MHNVALPLDQAIGQMNYSVFENPQLVIEALKYLNTSVKKATFTFTPYDSSFATFIPNYHIILLFSQILYIDILRFHVYNLLLSPTTHITSQ